MIKWPSFRLSNFRKPGSPGVAASRSAEVYEIPRNEVAWGPPRGAGGRPYTCPSARYWGHYCGARSAPIRGYTRVSAAGPEIETGALPAGRTRPSAVLADGGGRLTSFARVRVCFRLRMHADLHVGRQLGHALELAHAVKVCFTSPPPPRPSHPAAAPLPGPAGAPPAWR